MTLPDSTIEKLETLGRMAGQKAVLPIRPTGSARVGESPHFMVISPNPKDHPNKQDVLFTWDERQGDDDRTAVAEIRLHIDVEGENWTAVISSNSRPYRSAYISHSWHSSRESCDEVVRNYLLATNEEGHETALSSLAELLAHYWQEALRERERIVQLLQALAPKPPVDLYVKLSGPGREQVVNLLETLHRGNPAMLTIVRYSWGNPAWIICRTNEETAAQLAEDYDDVSLTEYGGGYEQQAVP